MATIVKVGDRFKCMIRKQGYPHRSRTFGSRADAIAWGREIESMMERGLYITPNKEVEIRTVADLLNKYLAEEAKRLASYKDYVRRCRTLKEVLGSFAVESLTHQDLSEYKRRRLLVRAPQTVLHELSILHHAYVVGVQDWGLTLPRGIPRTRRPALPPGRNRRISQKELSALLADIENPEIRTAIELAVETAMRRSELMELDWSRVDLERRTALLPHTKNGTARTVPLSTRAVELLEGLKKDTGKVFSVSASTTSQAFKRACKRAGMADVRFHDLRHEATSRLFEKGLHVIEVGRITGHKTLSMLDRYTHLNVQHLVDKLA